MLVVVFTNCQGNWIFKNWLSNTSYFKDCTYVHYINYDKAQYDIDTVKRCDLLIYQPTKSLEILTHIKPDCIKICMPCVYADMWPFYEEGGLFVGGHILDKYRKQGMSLDEIYKLYDEGTISFELSDRFHKSMTYLADKEKSCDISVSSFILQHYKNIRLFHTQNHPNGIIGAYMAKRICEFLGFELEVDEFTQKHLIIDNLMWPDSHFMKTELDLQFVSDIGKERYRQILTYVYNYPDKIKYKYT
jgi:hypothetical protein